MSAPSDQRALEQGEAYYTFEVGIGHEQPRSTRTRRLGAWPSRSANVNIAIRRQRRACSALQCDVQSLGARRYFAVPL